MKWAIKESKRIIASPKDAVKKNDAICPLCNEQVISKCGNIKVWHWSHKANKDCDDWYEPETEWHKNWKDEFPKEQQEVIIGKHRADIRTKDRWIIELQNSPLSSDKIIDRETYYKRMVWLLNGGTLGNGLRLKEKNDIITFRWKNPPKSWWSANKEIYIDLTQIVGKLKGKLNDYMKGLSKHSTPIYEEIYYEYYTPEGEHTEVSYPKISGYTDTTTNEMKKLKTMIKLFKDKIFQIKKIYPKIPCGGWGKLITKEEFLKKFKREDDTTTT